LFVLAKGVGQPQQQQNEPMCNKESYCIEIWCVCILGSASLYAHHSSGLMDGLTSIDDAEC
jgi:hypothetical protein